MDFVLRMMDFVLKIMTPMLAQQRPALFSRAANRCGQNGRVVRQKQAVSVKLIIWRLFWREKYIISAHFGLNLVYFDADEGGGGGTGGTRRT